MSLSEEIKNNILPSIYKNHKDTLEDSACKNRINDIELLLNDFISLDFNKLYYKSKELLIEAQLDILVALHNGLSGFYRQAFNSLRSSLELAMFSIYFKNRDYEYFLWEKSSQKGEDARWGNTFQELSKKVLLDYNNIEIDFNDYKNELKKINKLYGQLSNYTHGKPNYLQVRNLTVNEFDKGKFLEFLAKYKEVIESIIYFCNVFFEGELYE
jgi:hypothetical protein